MTRSLRLAFRDGHVRFALFLVVLTGLVQSFFLGKTFVDPGPRQYPLDFGKFSWVEPPLSLPAGYFRGTVYISRPVERAWLEVAATERYLIYINGKRFKQKVYVGERVTGIYDIRNLLLQGKNVIAVYVPRVYAPGSSQLRVRGAYASTGSGDVEFGTGANWKASNTPDGVPGSYLWFDTALDDARWPAAHPLVVRESLPAVQAVTVPLRLFTSDSRAQWIGASEGAREAASFEGQFELPADRQETWLQVASNGAYDVFVNGNYVIAQQTVQSTTLPFAQPSAGGPAPLPSGKLANLNLRDQTAANAALPLQVATQPAAPTLLAYDISRWLRTGTNRLLIRVRADNGPGLVLADASTLLPGGRDWRFTTGRNWQIVPGKGGVRQPARELGANGLAPWGLLPQELALPTYTPASDLVKYGPWVLAMTGTIAAFLILWVLTAGLFSAVTGGSLVQALVMDAVAHVPALAFLLICWLLTFDVRFNVDWCYHPWPCLGALGILFLGRLLLFLGGCLSSPAAISPPALPGAPLAARYAKLGAFAAVVLLGFGLRAWDLNYMSLSADEVTMMFNADGVLRTGYPHMQRGSFQRLLATYELIPYTLAASSLLFGRTEFAYHLPSLLFGTVTIALLGFAGTRMFDWRIGWVSAFIYACFPPAIAWSRNAFYPSQEQCLSLFTFWSFYEAIRVEPLRWRFVTWAAAGFIVSYLSWEGSGFIVPALFVALISLRWGNYAWMRDWHLWRCFVVMTVVVFSQLSYRQLTYDDYLGVGYSLSDITAPQLVYKDMLVYNPWYYVRVLFFPEVNFVLSLFLFLGFIFCWADKPIRYVVLVLFSLELCYTNFLPFYAPRYCYNAETLVILSGVAIFFRFRDGIANLGHAAVPRWFRAFRWSAAAALTVWLLLCTNEYVVAAYRLSPDGDEPALFARLGYYWRDHRGASYYIEQRLRPGDGVIACTPHMYEFYTHRAGDYSINTLLNEKLTYDGGGKKPYFIDKFYGLPLIRSIAELKELQSRYQRLWIMVPMGDAVSLSPDALEYVTRKGAVVFESYREQVFLLQGVPDAVARTSVLPPVTSSRN